MEWLAPVMEWRAFKARASCDSSSTDYSTLCGVGSLFWSAFSLGWLEFGLIWEPGLNGLINGWQKVEVNYITERGYLFVLLIWLPDRVRSWYSRTWRCVLVPQTGQTTDQLTVSALLWASAIWSAERCGDNSGLTSLFRHTPLACTCLEFLRYESGWLTSPSPFHQ